MVNTYKKDKNILVIIQNTIQIDRRLDLYIINKDKALKKQGYFIYLYIKILEDQIPII